MSDRIAADTMGVHVRALLSRLPLMVRALVLVPLLAVGLDQARVSFACGPDAQSCLDAAGHGRIGLAGALLLLTYVVGVAGVVGKLARGRSSLWLLATAGIWAACGGQALLASALGTGSLIGGGWMFLLAFGAAAGALLALALRTLPRLIRWPRAPRPITRVEFVTHEPRPAAAAPLLRLTGLTRDRAPPVTA
jgi:hypothetical protein